MLPLRKTTVADNTMMNQGTIRLLPGLHPTVSVLLDTPLPDERRAVLDVLIAYIRRRLEQGLPIRLNFICTHNSRRSQMAQIWAQTAAAYHGIPAQCFSGGVEVTAFNERAVEAVRRAGFEVTRHGDAVNPVYGIRYSQECKPIAAFSKTYDDEVNPATDFAAVMTCDHADENCPFIPGATRIAVRYEDPKAFDDTVEEALRYDERLRQIGAEMLFVFRELDNELP